MTKMTETPSNSAPSVGHWSDCTKHNEPAEPNDICSCGVDPLPSLLRALSSAVGYMKDAGAFMEDHPAIKHGMTTAKAVAERRAALVQS